jgi:predicted transposase YdaD
VLEDKRLAVEEAIGKTREEVQEEDRETARREKLEIARKLRARGLSGTEIADILNIDPGELPEAKS